MDAVERYLTEMERAVRGIPRAELRLAIDAVDATRMAGRTVFLVGNGGSAATASHMATDLTRGTRVEGLPAMRVLALTDNVPMMTAIANDQEYADVFADPLGALIQAGDVLIAISTSGNSVNVLRAVDLARGRGAVVIGFCGLEGGRLRERSDIVISIPAAHIGQQEDGHLMLGHVMTAALFERATVRAAVEGHTAAAQLIQ